MNDIVNKFKQMDSKQLIVYAILIIILIVAVIMFISKDDNSSNDNISEVKIEDQQSTYDSKLAAYNAKIKAEREKTSTYSTYDLSQYSIDTTLYALQNEIKDNVYETEDEDILRLQEMLRNSNKTEQTYYPPVTVNVPQSNYIEEKPIQTQSMIVKEPEPAPEPEPIKEEPRNRFFRSAKAQERGNSIPCVVHGEQTVTNGSTLKMRLLEDIETEEGITIPKNTYIFGIVKISEERMDVKLETVRVGKNIYSIKKAVYDRDGIVGINIPESIKAEIAKKASSSAIENTDVSTTSGGGNIVSTVGNAVTSATKSVLSKDKQEIRITVKSNYKLFLK